ncbi:hypothetical protein ACFQU7_33085 [Pseudoroseomonas wenyumeiae]
MILDTPGIREVGLVEADEGLSTVFDDIENLALNCRFRNCGHSSEPGCAVHAALDEGTLDAGRWAHFQKLSQELASSALMKSQVVHEVERRRLALLQKTYRTSKRSAKPVIPGRHPSLNVLTGCRC